MARPKIKPKSKTKASKRGSNTDAVTGDRLVGMGKVAPVANDHISGMIGDLVPDALQGDDRFLDIVTWNIRFFTSEMPSRVSTIASVLDELNADIFVFQEIANGALDPVRDALVARGSGSYRVRYGTTGGDQRVAVMYDLDWIRAKAEVHELFGGEQLIDPETNKDAFPRLPLHTEFTAHREQRPFDFHLVGVHLKSQRGGGGGQRRTAANRLMKWVSEEASDEDAIILGDWNAVATKPEWSSVRSLEKKGKVHFLSWNPAKEASHFFRSGEGSKLDYVLVTESANEVSVDGRSKVIPWRAFDQSELIRRSIINHISDHLPTLSRFYFQDKSK